MRDGIKSFLIGIMVIFLVAFTVEGALYTHGVWFPRSIAFIIVELSVNYYFALIIEFMEARDYGETPSLNGLLKARRVAEKMIIVELIEATSLFFIYFYQFYNISIFLANIFRRFIIAP